MRCLKLPGTIETEPTRAGDAVLKCVNNCLLRVCCVSGVLLGAGVHKHLCPHMELKADTTGREAEDRGGRRRQEGLRTESCLVPSSETRVWAHSLCSAWLRG